MKKLIFVTGDLASGKTRFSENLAKKYNICIIHKDPIKEILGDTVGFSNREENRKLSEASRSLMALFASEFIKSGQNLILESNFRKEEVERIADFAASYGYSYLVLILTGDVGVLHKRYVTRIENEHRHPVHQSITFDVFEDFKKYVEGTREQYSENAINIDATDFSYQEDKDLRETIESFLFTT